MNEAIRNRRERVEGMRNALKFEEARLAEAVRNCPHKWSNPEYDPIYRESYTIPGDPPGVGGSDHRSDCHVPAETINRWKRTCKICGEVQETTSVRETVTEHPDFNDL